jgi:hypothetical protein
VNDLKGISQSIFHLGVLDAKIKMRKRSRKFDGNVEEITLVFFSLK